MGHFEKLAPKKGLIKSLPPRQTTYKFHAKNWPIYETINFETAQFSKWFFFKTYFRNEHFSKWPFWHRDISKQIGLFQFACSIKLIKQAKTYSCMINNSYAEAFAHLLWKHFESIIFNGKGINICHLSITINRIILTSRSIFPSQPSKFSSFLLSHRVPIRSFILSSRSL